MMKIKNIIPALVGGITLIAQVSYGQIINGDFETVNTFNPPEIGSAWMINDANNPLLGNYAYLGSISGVGVVSSTPSSVYICTDNMFTVDMGTGNFLFVDGLNQRPFGSRGAIEIFSQSGIAIPSAAISIDFSLEARIFNNITLEVWLNGSMLGSRSYNSNHAGNVSVPLSGVLSGPNNILSIRQASFSSFSNGGKNDFGIDNIRIVCDGVTLPNPQFTINGSSADPLAICDPSDIKLNITMNNDADNYFITIRDLSTGIEHMRWLNSNEVNPANLSNFDLVQFANSAAQSSLDPVVESLSMDLVHGKCYSVGVVMTNECTAWAVSQQTICIEEECSISTEYYTEGDCNPVAFYATGGDGTKFFWDFGDGTSSTFQNPVHQYAEPGVYSVSLLVYKITACGTCCDVISSSLVVECGEFNGETMTWGDERGESGFFRKKNTSEQDVLENESGTNLAVFPNPTTDVLNVSFMLQKSENVNLEMYNSEGKLISTIMNNKTADKGAVNLHVETESLPVGIYHIIMSTDSNRETTSFVVSK